MAITSSPDPEENKGYYANDDYDWTQASTFLSILQAHFAYFMTDGGDIDRLGVAAIIGRNSFLVRLDRMGQTHKPASEWVVEGENQQDEEFRQVIPFAILEGENRETATTRWIAEANAALATMLLTLRLPFSMPPEFRPQPVFEDVLNTVPDRYAADEP